MMLLRVLRALDDLAEILIFDHLLATNLRRRLASVAASILMLAAYASSGFWMAPSAPPSPPSAPGAMPATERPALPGAHVDLAAEIVRTRNITPAQDLALRRVLAIHEHELERYLTLAGDTTGLLYSACERTGHLRASGVATLLLARGLLMARVRLDSSAVKDWIAVLHIASALAILAPADPRDLSAHVVGGVLENSAVRLLSEQLRTRGLDRSESAQIVRSFSVRTPLGFMMGRQLKLDLDEQEAIWTTWARTNHLPASYRGLRFYLPVAAASRRAVAKRVLAQLSAQLFEIVDRAQSGAAIPRRPPVRIAHVAGWAIHLTDGAGWSERLATLWSNDRAADVASRLVLCWRSSHVEDHARSCQRLAAEARALAAACQAELNS